MINIKDKTFKPIYDDIYLLLEIIREILNSGTDYFDDKLSLWTTNSDIYIDKVLVKQKYPKQMPHYETMCERIKGKHCIISENDSCITINDSDEMMIAEIFKINHLKVPNSWFDFYSFNIGFEHKSDHNHMFPFVLDQKLENISCYEIKSLDGKNLKYFYGTFKVNKKKHFGFFEYFIDATGTLFHRMFRPYDELSDKLKHKFMKHLPEEYKIKYKLDI